MLKLNRGDQAKQCFMEALALDVKCYDAFDQLVTGEMMTPDEGARPLYYPLPFWLIIRLLSSRPQNGSSCKVLHILRRPHRMRRSCNSYTQHDCESTNT